MVAPAPIAEVEGLAVVAPPPGAQVARAALLEPALTVRGREGEHAGDELVEEQPLVPR